MLTLDQLVTPTTKDEALSSLIAIAADLDLPTTAWQDGDPIKTVLEVCAQKISDLSQVYAFSAKAGFLDYASQAKAEGAPVSDWLTILALSQYGVARVEAASGSTPVTIRNSTGGILGPYSAGDLHLLNSATGQTYTTTNPAPLSVPAGGSVSFPVVADVAGTASNAAPGAINAFVTPVIGLTCTNPAALVGVDAETDPQLVARCRLKLAAMSPNGPSDAYNYAALTAVRADGSPVGITRTRTLGDNTEGVTTLYVASASGPVSGTEGNPATDLGAVNLAIQLNVVPTGHTGHVVSAAAHNILVISDVFLARGNTVSAADAQAAVLASLVSHFAALPIGGEDLGTGGYVFLDAIIGVIFATEVNGARLPIVQATVTTPGGNVALAANEVPILTSVLSNITVHQL